MKIISEMKEDIECLKYYFKHGTLNGSTVRLARMIRMIYITTIISTISVLIFVR